MANKVLSTRPVRWLRSFIQSSFLTESIQQTQYWCRAVVALLNLIVGQYL